MSRRESFYFCFKQLNYIKDYGSRLLLYEIFRLEHGIDAVDEKKWPSLVKALIETPLYLGLAALKTSRLIMRAILSPIETAKEAALAIERACKNKVVKSAVASMCGLFKAAGGFRDEFYTLSPQAQP